MEQTNHLARHADGLLERSEHHVLGLRLRAALQELVLVEGELVLYAGGQSGDNITPEAAVQLTMKK